MCPLRAEYRTQAARKVVPLWSGCWEEFPYFAGSTDKACGCKSKFLKVMQLERSQDIHGYRPILCINLIFGYVILRFQFTVFFQLK